MRQLVPVALFLVACSGAAERSEADPSHEGPSCSLVIDDNGVCGIVLHDTGGAEPLDEMGVCPLSCE